MTRRRVWDDHALESPRAGYVMTGAGAAILIFTGACGLLGLIAGIPAWGYLLTGMCAIFGAACLGTGVHEVNRSRRHQATMRAYGDQITQGFERILQERRPGR